MEIMKGYNRNVSPVLRRVFSRTQLYVSSPQIVVMDPNSTNSSETMQRAQSRQASVHSGSSRGKNDPMIDITTSENVQFMDQPLKGRVDLMGLPAPVETVTISLRGVVKTCVAGNAAWASGFGSTDNVMARF